MHSHIRCRSFHKHFGCKTAFSALTIALLLVVRVVAQSDLGQQQPGAVPFATMSGGQYDSINLASLAVTVHAPLRNKSGLIPFSSEVSVNPGTANIIPGSAPGYGTLNLATTLQIGADGLIGIGFGIVYREYRQPCNYPITGSTVIYHWGVLDSTGALHDANITTDRRNCLGYPTYQVGATSDGTYYKVIYNAGAWTVYNRSGNVLTASNTTVTDPNNNTIKYSVSVVGNQVIGTYTDSLNVAVVNIASTTGSTDKSAYWLDANANQQTANFTIPQLYQGTNFQCGLGASDTGSQPSLLTNVAFADTSQMAITYEVANGITNPLGGPVYTGRLASLTIPTGATISYTYSGGTNGINCIDGTPNTVTRTTPDGTWTYVHTPQAHPSVISTTSVKDPLGNETDFTFSGQYETLRKVYAGSCCTTLLQTVQTCYNASCTNAAAPPITERDTYSTFNGQTVATRHQVFYNSYGLTTQVNEYSNSTTLLRATLVAYGTWNNTNGSCDTITNTNVHDRVCYRQVWDETGTPTMVSNTRYTYDGNGNRTSSAVWTGSQYLTSTDVINSNGTPSTSTSPLGLVSTLGYSCNSGLMSSTSYNVSVGGTNLSTSSVLDCNGAAPTSDSDMNGQGPTFVYGSDPYYRPTSITDAMSNATLESYGSGGTYVTTTYPTSNGNSNTATSYADTLGRQNDIQTADGTTYDTTTIYRNWVLPYFNIQRTMPCSQQAAQGKCPTAKSVTTSYDALGRTVSTVDANGKQVSYTYFPATVSGNNVNDVVVSVTGKSDQFEYDALGRLVSVCEVSTQTGYGACGQANAKNGFVTSYTYNMLGKITRVTQGAQTRTFSYDALNRLLSETNPESGATNYTWDSATATCTTPYPGHLVQKADANGNKSCMKYDLFGRLVSAVYSGPNAVANSYIVYDAATYSGTAIAYAKGHIAEAYTCTSCPGTKITDEFFSYNKRGELTDVWEKTPHSPSAYYHTTAGFYPNHLVASLTVPGSTTNLSWALDGKGRPYSATANNGAVNLVGSTVYDPADRPLTINLGLGDQDTYVYDNGERMKNFTFTVGSSGKSVQGALTWNNNNGTLGTLQITDGWNSTATETCNYGYDDMLRINSDACGSVWSQTFSYDRYGNITKSGSQSFAPGYTAATNRYSSLLNATYDNNGNLTNDGTNGYTFDANNLVATVVTGSGTNGVTRDAFGRMVEIARSGGTYTEVLYSAIGKTANMNGNNVQRVFAPLPGGNRLSVETTGSNYYFHHKDWLGTSRFISVRGSRSMYFDTAYAPFGENYSNSGTTDLDFTDQRQDITAGIYDFQYREYNPVHGRWVSPDPSGLHAVNPMKPQTWNRYVYVSNRPLNVTDRLGLEEEYGNADEEEVQSASSDGEEDLGQFPGFGGGSTGGGGAGGSWGDPSDPNSNGGDSGTVDVVNDPNFGGSVTVTGEGATVATENVADPSRGVSDFGGIFSNSQNAAGGDVWTTTGRIGQSDVGTMVNSGLFKGDVNIITGVHGFPNGGIEAAPEFFAADTAAFGGVPGVAVYDMTAMTEAEISGLLEGTGTTILAFCDSACWLALF